MAETRTVDNSGRVAGRFTLQRDSETSAANTNLTIQTATGAIRQITLVTIAYSGNSSTTGTVRLNSGVGTGADVQIGTIAFSTSTEGIFQPAQPLFLMEDDTLDVLAPQVTAVTSTITIYSRVF